MSYASERVRALQNAQRMLEFNARTGTVCAITGISQKELLHLIPPRGAQSGRWPSTHEWYHTASLAQRVEASLFAVQYWRNRRNGFEVVESLIDAYGRYRTSVGEDPLISFDRAFNLICHLEGNLWGVESRSFDIAVCPHCTCQHLIQLGDQTPIGACIFCRWVQRFAVDARLQSRFPPKRLPVIAEDQIAATAGTVARDSSG